MNKPKYKTETFIKKTKEIHGNRYDYSITEFKSTRDKISYICPKHGIITQRAGAHLLGQGCSKCAYDLRKNSSENFIKRAKEIHDSKRKEQNLPPYDYSKTKYTGSEDYVTVICPIHGEFKQLAHVHLSGSGCIKCGQITAANKNQRYSTSEFIKECKLIHDKKRVKQGLQPYNYSKTEYYGMEYYSTFICPIHGEFKQLALTHLQGSGCPKCANNRIKQKLSYSLKEWEQKGHEIHDKIRIKQGLGIYQYRALIEKENQKFLEIYCPECGENFIKNAALHLSQKQGCPICSNRLRASKFEIEFQNFLDSLNIKYKTNDRKILKGKELDIYIPEKQIAFELDGLHWHSDLFISDTSHLSKTNECEKQGIQLIHVFEDEWLYKQSIVESRIQQILGITKFKIPARKCYLRVLDTNEERSFFENNHLQGYIGSAICYGLFYHESSNNTDYLVSAMSFCKQRNNLGNKNQSNWELLRFCNLKSFCIIGGASKIFKHFINKFEPKIIISYADRRWSIKNEHTLYEQLGFKFDSFTKPSYFYIDNDKRINRFSLRKDIMVSKYNCNPELTEYECVKETFGYHRIYDCGNLKYIWEDS